MAQAYSVDLRKIVLEQQAAGMPIQELCRVFKLGAATIYRWLVRKKETGTIAPTKQARRGGSKPTLKSEEYEEFTQFLKDNVGLNSIQLAKKWGRGMIPKTLRMWVKRLGFTLKKTILLCRSKCRKTKSIFRKTCND